MAGAGELPCAVKQDIAFELSMLQIDIGRFGVVSAVIRSVRDLGTHDMCGRTGVHDVPPSRMAGVRNGWSASGQ